MVEANVELTVVMKAEKDGWFVRKIAYPGRRGATDRVFIKNGRTVWIEFKDTGKEAQALQARNRQKMIDAGAECHVVDNIMDGLRILGIA